MIPAVAYMHAEPLFYLSEMFVKLAAEVGQDIIIGGLQQEFPCF
jgi:hypothetical protein